MILIFSEIDDDSTNDVIEWLEYRKIKFLRINPSDTISIHCHYYLGVSASSQSIEINHISIKLDEVKSIWYRRGGISKFKTKVNFAIEPSELEKEIIEINNKEYATLTNYLTYLLAKKFSVGSYYKFSINKLQCLDFAKTVGLVIPETIVTTKKAALLIFIEKHREVINKPMYEGLHSPYGENMYHTYTEIVDAEFIHNLDAQFLPACFQEKLNKKFEIRTFFLDGETYSMAIFSQMDPKTKLDFRRYNNSVPNRVVPFDLPSTIVAKLHQLMQKLKLNCGSFDLVYTEEKKFVFLEINPVGQYGMVSVPCNYFLDNLIALKLSSFENL